MHLHLRDYLAGKISLDDLKEWLIDATWDLSNTADSPDRQLAFAIELVLAEASSGYLTPDELHADLQALLDRAALRTPA
jgi:hypothetical protein